MPHRGGVFSAGGFVRTSRADADVFEVISKDWREDITVLACTSCAVDDGVFRACAACCASRTRFSTMTFLAGIVMAVLNAAYLAYAAPSMQ